MMQKTSMTRALATGEPRSARNIMAICGPRPAARASSAAAAVVAAAVVAAAGVAGAVVAAAVVASAVVAAAVVSSGAPACGLVVIVPELISTCPTGHGFLQQYASRPGRK